MAKKLPYQEGTAFAVTLPKGGMARGVVARMAPNGKVLLGYFFGPSLGKAHDLGDMKPSEAVLVGMFGDLFLYNGKWPIIGQVPDWNRSHWPIPEFIWRDPLGYIPDQVVVVSEDLMEERRERRAIIPDGLTGGGLMGAGFVELKLEKLLGQA